MVGILRSPFLGSLLPGFSNQVADQPHRAGEYHEVNPIAEVRDRPARERGESHDKQEGSVFHGSSRLLILRSNQCDDATDADSSISIVISQVRER